MRAPTTRRLAIAAVSLWIAASSPGSASGQGVAVGVRGGANLADLSSDQFEFGTASGRTRFAGGVFVTFAGRQIAGQPELLFAQRGFDVLGAGGSARTDVSYVDIPILLKFRLRPNRKVRPALLVGGFISLETSCNVTGDATGVPSDGDCDAFFPARGKTDAGGIVGAALDVGLADRYFLALDARYALGLLNLNWDDVADRVNSRVLSFTAGVGILLGS